MIDASLPTGRRLTLHRRQAEFCRQSTRFSLFCGGIGSGKTFTGALRFIARTIEHPRSNGYVLANTYAQLRDATLAELERLAKALGFRVAINWGKREITIGSRRARFASLERFNILRGIEIGHFWLDEARDVRAEAFSVVRGRLRHKHGPLRGDLTTTPNGLHHWLYPEFEANPGASVSVVRASTEENAANLPPGYVDDLRRSYQGAWFEQEVLGHFTDVRRGRCYARFDRTRHAKAAQPFDPRVDLLVGIDFNVDPMTAVVAQRTAEGLAVVGEYKARDADTFALREWLSREWAPKLAPGRRLVCFPDASGEARSTSGASNAEILRERFIVRSPRANPAQRDRVNAVNRLLREGALAIDSRCGELIASLEQTVWDDRGRIDKSAGTEHITDALGYLVWGLFPIREPTRVRRRRL